MRFGHVAALLAASIPCGAFAADPDLLNALNAARGQGCQGRPGIAQPLAEDLRLSEAARALSQNVRAEDALSKAGYRATRWAQIAMSGSGSASAIAAQVAQRSCEYLLETRFSEAGLHRLGNRAWIVFAAPFAPPAPGQGADVARRVLDQVNAARSQARKCGATAFAAAGPVRLNEALSRAAAAHAEDMATRGFFRHEGSDGSTPAQRATRARYSWKTVGENIASGQSTPESAVAGWIQSPPHCANLMNPAFAEMGIAFAVNPASPMGIYWAQVFGTQR